MITHSNSRQPTSADVSAVRSAFDPHALIRICEAESVSDTFLAYADRYDLSGEERFYYHDDTGSPILAIAHLDTVQPDRSCAVTETSAGLLATSGALDDRLGAYVLLELLPRIGLTFDVLLTTDEEQGRSTASDFDGPAYAPDGSSETADAQPYRWMFQFDRAGKDVVTYQYESDELDEAIRQSGAQVGVGIYSDITDLDHLGCAGVNWGVGYQDYHSRRSHAWLEDTFLSVARFVNFYRANEHRAFPYVYDPDPLDPADLLDSDYFDSGLMFADCNHVVDIDDHSSYIEIDRQLLCASCGAI